jgi:septum formation protein
MSFCVISTESPLLLASSSPRRKKLLRQIGLPFRSFSSAVEEDLSVADPGLNARVLSEKKARKVLARSRGNWVLGADTVVVLDHLVLGKPESGEEARFMLLRLSGREHRVITGFCLLDPAGHTAHSEAVVTRVKMKELTEDEVRRYVASGEPYGKAGSYAIQGLGAFMVESISGSYTNVVGLPLCALVKALLAAGALRDFPLTGADASLPQL